MPCPLALMAVRRANTRRRHSGKASMHSAEATPAKTLVLAVIGRRVAAGHAEWKTLESGEIELHLPTGETFLLAEATIIRLA